MLILPEFIFTACWMPTDFSWHSENFTRIDHRRVEKEYFLINSSSLMLFLFCLLGVLSRSFIDSTFSSEDGSCTDSAGIVCAFRIPYELLFPGRGSDASRI